MTVDKESLGRAVMRALTIVAMIAVGYLVGYIHGVSNYSRAAPELMFGILVAYNAAMLLYMLYHFPRPLKPTAN